MNTKLLMTGSALAMGGAGLLLTFLPQELLQQLGATPAGPLLYVLQLTGALYLSFAVLNWMAKANLIGGIYSRPVALGNFLHFLMGALMFGKALVHAPATAALWLAWIVYGTFALFFGLVLFRHPLPQEKKQEKTLTGKSA